MAQEVMTAQQAAEFLQTSRDTVIRRARAGQLPAAKLGREWRFRRSDLDEWLQRGGDRYEKLVEAAMDEELRKRIREDDGTRIPVEEIMARYPA